MLINEEIWRSWDAQFSCCSWSATLADKTDFWIVPVNLAVLRLTFEVRPEAAGKALHLLQDVITVRNLPATVTVDWARCCGITRVAAREGCATLSWYFGLSWSARANCIEYEHIE